MSESGLEKLIEEIAGLRGDLARQITEQKPLMVASRQQFESMVPAERMAFVKRGGKLHDR
jgi:hypothetical protein